MLKGLFILEKESVHKIYNDQTMNEIKGLVDIIAPPMTKDEILENKEILKEVDVVFSGWGGPKLDEEFLQAAPNMKVLFYGAGSIKNIVTDEFWKSGIRVTTANTANAVPVAEFTLARIILGLKNSLYWKNQIKETREYPSIPHPHIRGCFDSTVGIISMGAIGRQVNKLLKHFDLNILVHDPFLSEEEAKELGVTLVSLEEIFKESDVVSLHSPWLKETEGMIRGDHIRSMKEYGVFINTARGIIVREEEMIEALKERKDISAYIDVVYPEPPKEDSELYELDNLELTPHIAGSEGKEIGRMGKFMLDELKIYLESEELEYEVSEEAYNKMA